MLRSLPDKATCNFLLEWYLEKHNDCAFHQPSVIKTASSLWTTFGKQLKEPRYVLLEYFLPLQAVFRAARAVPASELISHPFKLYSALLGFSQRSNANSESSAVDKTIWKKSQQSYARITRLPCQSARTTYLGLSPIPVGTSDGRQLEV